MRILTFSALLLIMALGVSCGNKKKKKQEQNKVELGQKYTTDKGSTVYVLLADMNDKINSDPFTLIDAHIDDLNKLHLTVEYSGGCKPHEFKILGSKAILKSFPAQRPVMIQHTANNDECRSIIREEIIVEISEFAYSKEHGSEIILLIDGQRLSYKYQDSSHNDK